MNYAEEEFEQAWNNPANTQIKLGDVDINDVLAKYYETPIPVNFTREMLWDMGAKKAWDPKIYIPYAVRAGKSWGKKILENGDEVFFRSSEQNKWLNKELYDEIFEEVYLNHKDQIATFLGRQDLVDESGKTIHTENHQPLFHVQQSVEGEESNPINVWRIVHLTDGKDLKLIQLFKKLENPTALPGYAEIYIKKDLKVPLLHK
ncbi:MAG: hypothetical protein WC222_03845 [Parachlamydiales bacterium]|jgi:hypothetical protein